MADDHRLLFVEHFLVRPELGDEAVPGSWYDEERDLTLMPNAQPLVEASGLSGTMTNTAAVGEHSDDDAPAAWAETTLETRAPGWDVGKD